MIMLSIESLRRIDPSTAPLTDKELDVVRNTFYELGQLMFDDWQEQQVSPKYPIRVLTTKEKDIKYKYGESASKKRNNILQSVLNRTGRKYKS